ncbi:hypothetical protein [Streptomyces bullii]|uniref:Uncharacterized protein n=1 Tax=Streptomyces bullii TaxID=349910 RepID=A0ABW0UL30_9ACTN
MTDEQSRTPVGPLTGLQRARIDFARRDLDYARSEDLTQLPPASLILLIERLRTRLDDALAVIDELTDNPN